MGVYPVTTEQYRLIMGDYGRGNDPNVGYAMYYVDYDKAVEFCGKLPTACRLPTEAEWEFACRAGTNTRFFFGDGEKELRNYALAFGDWGHPNEMNLSVGRTRPNPWGLYDLYSLDGEWCSDWLGPYEKLQPDRYGNIPIALIDPKGPANPVNPVFDPSGRRRVVRGCCAWVNLAGSRSRHGCDVKPTGRGTMFRVVMEVK